MSDDQEKKAWAEYLRELKLRYAIANDALQDVIDLLKNSPKSPPKEKKDE